MSSKLVIKKSERKNHSLSEQPLNSSSESSNQRVKEKDIQPAEESIQAASRKDCRNLDIAGNNNVQCKNVKTSQVHDAMHASTAKHNLLPTSSALSDSPPMSKGLQISSISASASATVGQLLQVEALPMSSSQDKHKPKLEVHKPVLPLSSDIMKKPLLAPDDDDLPEFDFGTACSIPQTPRSKVLDSARVEKKLPAEEFTKLNRSLPPTMPPSNLRALGDFSVPRRPLDAFWRMLLQKKVREDYKTPALTNSERKHAAQSMIPISSTAVPLPKDIFYEDDDMPEWCPPNIELHREMVSETTVPSTTTIFSGLCRHMRPSPSPAVRPPFSTQGFTHEFHCSTSQNVRPAQSRSSNEYILRAPNSLSGFSSNPLMRPPLKPFDVKLPVHPAGWRVWRP